jgi:nucleoside-diphosphate-sugar epimerase
MLPTNSKIFITGATGFVGSYIVRSLLGAGYNHLFCLKRNESDISLLEDVNTLIQWVTGDILDIPLLETQLIDVDVVIHAAAIVSFSTGNKKKLIETAMSGTANLVNISLECGIKKFIHISSIAAIGRRKKKESIDENLMFSHSEFDTTYGLSKFLAEQEVWRGHAEGLDVTILNPSMILGAGNWNQSSVQIYKKVYQGMKYYPEGINGWVDVRDVADATLLALKGDYNGQRFIISAENAAFKTIFEKIASHLNVKAPNQKINYLLAGIVWRLESLRSYITGSTPIITRETIKSTSVEATYDNSKSQQILGMTYRPLDVTISQSCQSFVSSWPNGVKFGLF